MLHCQRHRQKKRGLEPREPGQGNTETPTPETGNHLMIDIEYRIRANNAFYNLAYPFFLDEGTH